MTVLEDRSAEVRAARASLTDPPVRTPRQKRALAIVAVLVGVLVVGLGSWFAVASSALNATGIVVDAAALRCDDPADAALSEPWDEDFGSLDTMVTYPMVRVDSGVRCEYSFIVVNESGLPLEIRRITMPYLGPGSGAPVHAVSIAGPGTVPLGGDRIDAVFDLSGYRRTMPGATSEPIVLEPGTAMRLSVTLESARDAALDADGGCRTTASELQIRSAVLADVSIAGMSGQLSSWPAGLALGGPSPDRSICSG